MTVEPITAAGIVGSVATAAISGIIVAASGPTWPWPAIGVGVTIVSLIWGVMLKLAFTQMEMRLAQEMGKLHEAIDKKLGEYVPRKEYDATIQPMMRRRENRL